MTKQTQCDAVVELMKETGSITPVEAMQKIGCMRLGARIYDLRQQGYRIDVETARSVNRFGEPVHFARYSLAKRRKV